MALCSADARPSRPVSHIAGTSPDRSPLPLSSCTQSRAGRALRAHRLRGSYWLVRVAHNASKSASIPLSSASPTTSVSCPARQSPSDKPCIQAIPKPSSSRVPAPSQANQGQFSEKAGLSGRLSDSCAEPVFECAGAVSSDGYWTFGSMEEFVGEFSKEAQQRHHIEDTQPRLP